MSKAQYLDYLSKNLKKSTVDLFFHFSVGEWKQNEGKLIKKISNFGFSKTVIIRSSSVKEDSDNFTYAGTYRSILNVDSADVYSIKLSIEKIIQSFEEKDCIDFENRIIIQNQATSIKLSGVAFTIAPKFVAPYFIIEYDDLSGLTDQVTGTGDRGLLCCFKDIELDVDSRWYNTIEAIREIQLLFPGKYLNIEFAIDTDNKIHTFQVRPIPIINKYSTADLSIIRKSIERNISFYKSQEIGTIYSNMSDWNPAEMLGSNPSPLAFSLYRYLITSKTWNQARMEMGYANASDDQLMIHFSGKPYINVKVSLQSLLPGTIDSFLREKIVAYQLNQLRISPFLHDKIEFELAFSCFDFASDEKYITLLEQGFTELEVEILKKHLRMLTKKLIDRIPSEIDESKKTLEKLRECFFEKNNVNNSDLSNLYFNYSQEIKYLLNICKNNGILPFAKLARYAFIGDFILKRLVQKGILLKQDYERFYAAIRTIPKLIEEDKKKLFYGLINEKDFIEKYKHLRAGTYDINVPRYGDIPILITENPFNPREESISGDRQFFTIKNSQRHVIGSLLKSIDVDFDVDHFFQSLKSAIEWRELAKFEFTKVVSEVLEKIASLGNALGFSRQELSYLYIEDIIQNDFLSEGDYIKTLKRIVRKKKAEKKVRDQVMLPSLIKDEKDFWMFESLKTRPNFITYKKIQALVIFLDSISQSSIHELSGKIVCIEAADPGYDWIFLKKISGLVTKFGGVASHMAIRCHELNIPAVIGCGEFLFNKITSSKIISINCKEEMISFIN